ncbi:hypothetical protein DP113_34445 (plasmid) [Brasilonema octagenarum UFV-E1]|uniref:Uncharacterized protein n=2 Tax=Brasilonema TaxID=383614 RepID=A0A856MN04_9CYAN|nr:MULTISPECIES: hypothetical protein [Brasilonema]NMF63243.1 hypothetical protein [Brasilonema octagenarum UFV-OR1]QDL12815.1 hypothetical protein DP114_34340 [Brasilonema sennae CENA114]QDL19211.1 hypothetical protein DP113_34445 [Brasilonema octagenarum UFV-E1]
MNIYWLTRIANFQGSSIRLLDIDTGIEFFAKDILMLVCPRNVDKEIQSFLEVLPLKLRRKRQVFTVNHELQEVDTLCWLALKYIFNLFGYEKHREFVRWLRKDVAPISSASLSLSPLPVRVNNPDKRIFNTSRQIVAVQSLRSRRTELLPIHNTSIAARLPASELIVTKLNSLHWFNIITNCQLMSLSDMYLNSRFSLVGSPLTLVPAIHEYSLQNENLDIAVLEAIYLSFLYKQVDIPLLDSDTDLSNKLLRKRYLDCCRLILENENISYSDLYLTFVNDAEIFF